MVNQHIILGSGLTGCFIGSVLLQTASVTFVGRPTWLNRLQKGFYVTDANHHSVNIKVAKDACREALQEPINHSIIWLTVKNTALEKAARGLAPLLGKNCVIICCQNGVDAADKVQSLIQHVPVLQGIVGCNVIWDDAARALHRATDGVLYVQQPNSSYWCTALSNLSNDLLTISLRTDIQAVAWAKLQLNLANSVNAIVNKPIKQMLLDKGCREVIAGLMEELLDVTDAKGMKLPKMTRLPASWIPAVLRLPTWLFGRVANAMLQIDEHARSSMWWDVEAGYKTEIDYLNHWVVETGRQCGVECPLNQGIVAEIKALENAPLVANRPPLNGNVLKNKLHLK